MAGTEVSALPTTMQQLAGSGGRQLLALMLAASTAVALAVGAWMWSQTPDYRVLFSTVNDRDGGAIIAALTQMNVPYKFAEGGSAILVPATLVHEARLRLASQGLPKGSLVGFESMESPKLGTSQFLEQVNFQRALEGELARSIQSVAAVASARVHLAIPKQSVFLREQQKPSASVLVNLHAGRSLESGQVSAIVHLVSSSVPELTVKNVTVVDQNGNLLSAQGEVQANGLDPNQLNYVREIEQGFAQRVESILTPVVGAANVRAQVTADVDFSQTEQAEEAYRPNQGRQAAAVRSRTSSEAAASGPGSAAGGIPGALSNQPSAPASAPITGQPPGAAPASTTAAAAGPSNTHKESAINYEVDKTLKHIRHSTGTIKRLSVAVVVNHRKLVTKDGKSLLKARSEDEMAQLNKLVREAMGYSETRGDTVTVANTPFTVEEVEPLEQVPLWKQPATWALVQDIGKHLLIAAVVLFLFLRVLRPLFRSILSARPVPPDRAGAGSAAGEMLAAPRTGPGYERNLEAAKQLARQEPKLVANIVRTWVAGDER